MTVNPSTIDTAAVDALLTRSARIVSDRDTPLHLSMVLAMYKEDRRIRTRDVDPIGEDFLNVKVSQLTELFEGNDGWDLTLVDDGCPNGSGQIAQQIIDERGYPNVRVLYLADAIKQGHPVTAGLRSPADSQKGGSILLGMYEAAQISTPGHVIAYTDADISTDLRQTGNLIRAIDEGAISAAGSRREPESVVVKSAARSDRGKLFIYLWKQLLPELTNIIDSQCGFKGFAAHAVDQFVMDTVEKGFAFDIELLLRSELAYPNRISRVPVAWIDSEAGSTTTDLEPYLPMLNAVTRMYRKYATASERRDEFADLIEGLTPKEWDALVDRIPRELAAREPIEFSSWAGLSASDFRD